MVLVLCILTTEILFLAPKFFFFTIRAERLFVVKAGNGSQQCIGDNVLHEANTFIGNYFFQNR